MSRVLWVSSDCVEDITQAVKEPNENRVPGGWGVFLLVPLITVRDMPSPYKSHSRSITIIKW